MARKPSKKIEPKTSELPIDQRYLDAWLDLPEPTQSAIRRALKRPTPLIGAYAGTPRDVKTPLGYAISCGFVTGLGAALVETADWHAEAS